MSERPYSRLYWEVMDDPKFDGIREDVRHFGSWCLMLVVVTLTQAFVTSLPMPLVRHTIQKLVSIIWLTLFVACSTL